MSKEIRFRVNTNDLEVRSSDISSHLHPAWQDFLGYCEQLQFGEIEKLKIQDGLPVLAEVTTKKVRFGG
jgi:hypothetical protein